MAAVPTRPRASTLPAKKPQTLPVKHQHYPYGDDELDQTQSSTNSVPPSSRPASRPSGGTAANHSTAQGSSTPNRAGATPHESHTRPPAPAHVPTKGASRAASPILTAPPRPSASARDGDGSRSNREPSQRPPSRMDSNDSTTQRTRTPPPNPPRHTPVPSRSSTPGAGPQGPIHVPPRRPPSQSSEPVDRDEPPPPQQQAVPARPTKATVDNTSVKPVKEQRGTIEQNAEAQEQAQPPRKAPPPRHSEPRKTNEGTHSSAGPSGQSGSSTAAAGEESRQPPPPQEPQQQNHAQPDDDHRPSDQHSKSEPTPEAPTEHQRYGSLPEALTYVSVVLKPASGHSAEAPKLFRLTLRGDCGQIAVQSLKEALADFSGIPVDRQRLIKDGVTLGNAQLGAEFGLRAGTVLYLDRMFSENPSTNNASAAGSEPSAASQPPAQQAQTRGANHSSGERAGGPVDDNGPKATQEEKNQTAAPTTTAPSNAEQKSKHGVVSVNGRTDSDRQGVLTLTDGKQISSTEEFEFKLNMEQQLEELKAIELSLGRLKEALNVRRRLFSRAQHEREVRLAKEEQAKREELRQLRAMRSRVVYETAAVPYRSGPAAQERKGRGFRPISPILTTGQHPVMVQYRDQPQYYVIEEDDGEGESDYAYAGNPDGGAEEQYSNGEAYGYDGGNGYANFQDPYQAFLYPEPHSQAVELQGMESQPHVQVVGGRTAKPRMALSPHHADVVRHASRAPSKSSSAPPLPVDPSWSAPRPTASTSAYRRKSTQSGVQRGVSQGTFVVGEEITDDLLVDLSQDNLPVPVSSGRGGSGGGHMLLQPQPRYSSNTNTNQPVYQSSRGLGQWEQRNVTNSPTRHHGHYPNHQGTGAHGSNGAALTSPFRD